ncbi:Pyruvate dehydrogenase E1 component OS=Streptomyces rimosus subsp. rimosus (strain ATCC / DSM 40260 / JCM 4667 / NRRL 2234) OX=1265868 GN=aceE PE=4 SV=1 [Streptomyces rimosus subsp. rimosus]
MEDGATPSRAIPNSEGTAWLPGSDRNPIHIIGGLPSQVPDFDPEETQEWLDSLDAAVDERGRERARYLMLRLIERAREKRVAVPEMRSTDYVNTIPTAAEPEFPGDEAMEARITAWNRWNAAAMVTRGSRLGLGGHIATFASAAWLYETGFQHFFRGQEADGSGDQLYIQGHASPGIYARAYLEGRLTEDQLDALPPGEPAGDGLPSYPHPRRLPWLLGVPHRLHGPRPALRDLPGALQPLPGAPRHQRHLDSHVWAFLGDGEMDEPESTAALALAGREGLDNLTFVINCNLQRLDGPVRPNYKIVQELEAQFRAAGWNVIKSLWGRAWDRALRPGHRRRPAAPPARDPGRAVPDVRHPRPPPTCASTSSARTRRSAVSPRACPTPSCWSCSSTSRAGHEPRKVYAAYKAAVEHKGAPTVILAQTVKGYTLGEGFESRNANHQMKKLTGEQFRTMRDLLELPIPDKRPGRRRRAVRPPRRQLAPRWSTCTSAAPPSAARPPPARSSPSRCRCPPTRRSTR